jgi:hypothetical protein
VKSMPQFLFQCALGLLLFQFGLAQAPPAKRLLARFDNVTITQLVRLGIAPGDGYRIADLISIVDDTAFVILTPRLRDTVLARGGRYTPVMEDADTLTLIKRALYGPSFHLDLPYHTLTTLWHEIDSLQGAFPNLIKKFPIGNTTAAKAPINAVKICSEVQKDDDRPAILFDGCHHADEILGAEICLNIIRILAAGYGTDPEIGRWLNRFQIYVVPVINVDGYQVVTSGEDPRWRKNRRDTNADGILDLQDGVDINRNYDFNWAQGGSGEPHSERYRGAYPFSESEAQAMASFARARRFLASISYHSFGQVVFYPWMWKGRPAPDDSLLTGIAKALAGSIRTMKGDSVYRAEYGAGMVGQSYTWLYGALGTFDFVVETGWGASFPPACKVDGIVKANLEGVRAFLRRAEGPGIKLHVSDYESRQPVQAEVWFPTIENEEVHRRSTNPATGTYNRLLLPGSYQVIVSASGYEPAVLQNVRIDESGWKEITFSLKPLRTEREK